MPGGDPMSDTCRSCGDPIRWAKTAAGRSIPLDAEPRDDGNVILRDGIAIVFGPNATLPLDSGPRYVSHFTTCGQAAEWRKR